MGGLGLGLGLGVGNEVRAVCPTLGFGMEELGVGLGACVTEGFGDFGCFGLGLAQCWGSGLGLDWGCGHGVGNGESSRLLTPLCMWTCGGSLALWWCWSDGVLEGLGFRAGAFGVGGLGWRWSGWGLGLGQ